MIGFGSVAMESIYCAIALHGFSAFLAVPVVKAAMELLSFLFLLFLSWQYFSAKSIPSHVHSADVIEQKLHPRSAFMIGFVRVLGNPSVLLLWVTLTATFSRTTGWMRRWTIVSRASSALLAGATLWFLLLSWGVSRGHGRMSPRVLLRMEHISGAILLMAALWIGGRIVWQLHKQHLRSRSGLAVAVDVREHDHRKASVAASRQSAANIDGQMAALDRDAATTRWDWASATTSLARTPHFPACAGTEPRREYCASQ
jgi:threonine/homoserine/homoserine lactone efflux protein